MIVYLPLTVPFQVKYETIFLAKINLYDFRQSGSSYNFEKNKLLDYIYYYVIF